MNRCLFSIVILGVLLFTYASLPAEIFTKEESDIILNVIDNTCADSWCEGDFDYEFFDFRCKRETGSCNLTLYLIDEAGKRSSIQTCNFSKISNIAQVLESKKILNSNFYEVLDLCLVRDPRLTTTS